MAKINTPSDTAAVEDAYAGVTVEDPYDYTAHVQKLYIAKFLTYPIMNELMALRKGALAMKQYRQTFACAAGLNVGDAVYISAAGTVAKANASSSAFAKAIGFCRYKPTTTTCYIAHFWYASGLSGMTPGATVYLDNNGNIASAVANVPVPIGQAISITEALLCLFLAGSVSGVANSGNARPTQALRADGLGGSSFSGPAAQTTVYGAAALYSWQTYR